MGILRRWDGARWRNIRSYWHLIRRNHYNHRYHGRTQWVWGRFRRIGHHQYRLRTLQRNYNGHWRKVRSYWHMWRRNKYYRPSRWFWGRYRRVNRHLYRMRIYKRWDGARWHVVRRYWHLWRRNHYNHKYHGRQQWRWGRYRRIGVHLYRLRTLYRNYQGHWRRVRSYWHLWKRGHYYRKPRWSWGAYRRVGHHLYRQRVLRRWTGARWVVVRRYWRLYRRYD